jgi:hypothetical protein
MGCRYDCRVGVPPCPGGGSAAGADPGIYQSQEATVGELILDAVDPSSGAATFKDTGVNADGFRSFSVVSNAAANLTLAEKGELMLIHRTLGSKAAMAFLKDLTKRKSINFRNASLPPRQIDARWGGSTRYKHGGEMTAIQHVMFRHGPASGFSSTSKFSKGTSLSDVAKYADTALRYGKVQQNGGTGYVIQHNFGRTIGFNKAGDPTSVLKINVRDGVIKTAFPL